MGVAIVIPNVDFSDVNLGKVTLTDVVPVQALSINAPDSIVGASYQMKVSFIPINTSQRSVIWSVESGNEYASINPSSGLLSIQSTASQNNVTIKVVSAIDFSIYATKTVTVSFDGTADVPLEYIAADGGKYIQPNISSEDITNMYIDFKIPQIEINNTTDRQYIMFCSNNTTISYSKRWNMFAINILGKQRTINSLFIRANATINFATKEVVLKDEQGNVISLSNGSTVSDSYGQLTLYSERNDEHTMKKTLIYSCICDNTISLSPVLHNGVPCFYDEISGDYHYFNGEGGHIWYATKAAPDNEVEYIIN